MPLFLEWPTSAHGVIFDMKLVVVTMIELLPPMIMWAIVGLPSEEIPITSRNIKSALCISVLALYVFTLISIISERGWTDKAFGRYFLGAAIVSWIAMIGIVAWTVAVVVKRARK
jgi:hypothetical protein